MKNETLISIVQRHLNAKILSIAISIFSVFSLQANEIWTPLNNPESINQRAAIQTSDQKLLALDINELKSLLSNAAKEFSGKSTIIFSLPMPDGVFEEFKVFESPIMEEALALKFPMIKTYVAQSTRDASISGRLDIGPKGFHGMIFTKNGSVYIDPLNDNEQNIIKSYYKKDFIAGAKATESSCQILGEGSDIQKRINSLVKKGVSRPSGDELRTYRLAVGATGEYTAFHGGTVPLGLAAIVTSINRVVGIYEREVAVRMILVGNNDLVIFTNAATDPFTNNNTGTLINQSQTVLDDLIGNANYDVGHTFSTGAGGLAQLGVPCNNGNKARGVTGISSPVGDPFDVDYVAHELGHQFGGDHTFNGSSGSCSGNIGGKAYEPGSGSTIMAYAGICSPQNIQNNSDDYFHGASYDQIIAYTILSNGNNCALITNTGNDAPEVGVLEGNFIIPINTPFELTGNATDPNGDDMTFQWEQFDLGPQGNPTNPVGNAPIFRSFLPTLSPNRIFPRISDIVNNTSTIGEILPSYARNLKFRFNARDNRPAGGGVDHDFIDLAVEGTAGPFLVTVPNTAATYEVNSTLEVTWDVANTNIAPVSCQNVSIYLSTDGGFTYPITLIESTPNDGSAEVIIPNQITTTARIKVKAADNVFFDISNANFTIVEPSTPDFYVNIPNKNLSVCAPDNAEYEFTVEQLGGFSNPVTLSVTNEPAGSTVSFSTNPITPTESSTLTIGNTGSIANGTYSFDLVIIGGGITRNSTLTLQVFNGVPNSISLSTPSDAATALALEQSFAWQAAATAVSYDFELATDAAFTNIIATYSGSNNSYTLPNLLTPNTNYFWRVKGNNTCGAGAYSPTFTFTTDALSCTTFSATDLPKNIGQVPQTVNSFINVGANFTIADVNVLNLTGEHTWIADLDASLRGPDGTIVKLWSSPCDDEDNWDINFDDAAASGVLPCPLTDGNTYKPLESLSGFYGKSSQGNWVLTIRDNFNQDGGQFSSWSLEVCQLANGAIPTVNAPTALNATAISFSQINLEWTDNADNEENYIIERSLFSNTGFAEIANLPANITIYQDMGLSPNTTYYYKVKATSDATSSEYSNVAPATTFDLIPTIASDLIATATSNSTVKVDWADNSNNELGFIIDRSNNDNNNYFTLDTVAVNTETYTDMNLASGTIYYYKVAAYNAVGNSVYSNEDSALTQLETAIIDIALDEGTTVYPNPTKDILIVSIAQNLNGLVRLSLIDPTGKQIMQQHFEKSGFEFTETLQLNQLPKGLYLLEIKLNDSITYRKVHKM